MPPYAYAGKASRGLLQHIPSSSSHQIQLPSNQQSLWPLLSTSDSLPAPLTILSLISWGSLKVQVIWGSLFEKWVELTSVLCSYHDADLNIWLDSRVSPCGKSHDLDFWNRKHNIMDPLYQSKTAFLSGSVKISCFGSDLLSSEQWRSPLEELSLEKMQMQCSARGVRNTMTQIHCKYNCCRFCG